MTEIRWHARAGQGAKSASQLLAQALMHAGRWVQAFPEYGPERRGAPMRAYTRLAADPIRRRDPIEHPDVVVVLDETLLHEPAVTAGLAAEAVVVVNTERAPDEVRAELATLAEVVCVPADAIAEANGVKFANSVMVGAVAAAVGEPPLSDVLAATESLFGKKLAPAVAAASLEAVAAGYRHVEEEVAHV
jgi:2-oxoacid:acceptor oxidoreductase gamma subunit (pyruvate/2-ketoisovalerate family)